MKLLVKIMVMLFLIGINHLAIAIDIANCNYIPLKPNQFVVGLSDSIDNEDFQRSIITQGRLYNNVIFCKTDNSEALNQFTPWSKYSSLEKYYGWVVFGVALFVSIIFFSILPKRMREHITILGLIFIVSLMWVIATVSLTMINKNEFPQKYFYRNLIKVYNYENGFNEWIDIDNLRSFESLLRENKLSFKKKFNHFKIRLASTDATETISLKSTHIPIPNYLILQQKYENNHRMVKIVKVDETNSQIDKPRWIRAESIDLSTKQTDFHNKLFLPRQALNLRSGPSIIYKKLNVITPNTKLKATGNSFGDWWEITINNTDEKGWVNSLWLAPI